MFTANVRHVSLRLCLALVLMVAATAALPAQSPKAAAIQKLDEAYGALIKQHTQDPRVITELVDHVPVSDKVPSPLKFFGRIPGTPDELTYYKDMLRYYEAVDKASDRVTVWPIGKSEEGREMVVVAIADEITMKSLDKYKGILSQLTDPRKLTDPQARQLIATGKPIYWATGALHSSETGSPEMLMELTFRLAVEESPFIRNIRNNVITMFTPVLEVDGHEKQVDTYYLRKAGKPVPPLVYWGAYVAHDNNRDGLGVGLKLTEHILRTFLEWHPTVMHDLHESVPYLYASTGTGPYNAALDPIVVDEWWMLAKHEVNEMTKRGVPGVWTGGFYDGWVPNYLFFVANTHNSIGRFYETQSYGPQNQEISLGLTQTSREWYRPNPPLASIKWGPRNNVNIQQSALLFALQYTAKNKEALLENYYLKGKRAVERGKTTAPYAWVIPAGQRRTNEAASFVNLLRQEGVEIHTANAAFTSGAVNVAAGDYVVRMDQPYSTQASLMLDAQFFPPANPRPYDDTGWSLPLLRGVRAQKIDNKNVLEQTMTLLSTDAKVPGTVTGIGPVLIVDHTGDNVLVTFRFAHAGVKMLAAEEPFEAVGRKFGAGAVIIPNADQATIGASIKACGLSAWAVAEAPKVKTHELDVPRIGYMHSWSNTQNEGWVRMALDKFKVPYTYFGDIKLREGNLRAKYDVIIYPHVGGTALSQVNGLPMTGQPIAYKKTDQTPNLGAQDSADDIRGGMGFEGLMNLYQFVKDGGLLITEGSTSTIFPTYQFTPGVTIEEPANLFVRGSVLKALLADKTSPVVYGFDADAMAVYFSQAPVMRVGMGGGPGGGGFGGGGPEIPGVGQNMTPNAVIGRLATLEAPAPAATADVAGQGRGPGGGGRGGVGGGAALSGGSRVILRFPTNPDDMLLSGTLAGGEALSGRAVTVDAPIGKGHVVMFANRPFWRWQTHGSFILGFNAILNWNDLDAGKAR
jgi:hypothetical protein